MNKSNSPDPALKGKKGGNCNRTDCQKPHALFYNPYTYAWYCEECAKVLNKVFASQGSIMLKRCHIPLDYIEELWDQLQNIPVDENAEYIEEPFLMFLDGTDKEYIWHKFDKWLTYHDKNMTEYLLHGQYRKAS